MDYSKYLYESVFEIDVLDGKKKTRQVIARLFDPETKESIFADVTSVSIPDLFVATSRPNSHYKSYLDKEIKLSKMSFDNYPDFKKYVKKIKKAVLDEDGVQMRKTIEYDGEMIEIDLMEFEDNAFGYQNMAHTFIHRHYKDPVSSNHDHRIWFLDIETRSDCAVNHFPHSYMAPEEVTMIQIYDSFNKQYVVLGRKRFTGSFDTHLNAKYIHIEDEAELLEMFIRILEKQQPSIISGFNSKTFDMPYLTNRIAIVLDGFKGYHKEDLNKKNSYIDMPNVLRLSPVGVVQGRDTHTLDGMDGVEVFWRGITLLDYRELALKYGFLGLASYSLKNIAKVFHLSQKLDNSAYRNFDGFTTGDNYIQPLNDNPIDNTKQEEIRLLQKKRTELRKQMEEKGLNWKIITSTFDYDNHEMLPVTGEDLKLAQLYQRVDRAVRQKVWNTFTDYGLRDVEILVELNVIAGYLNSHKGIAYTCSVSMDDNWGTLKHWTSLIYRESFNNDMILPLKQQYSDKYAIWLAGWVRTMPGKYDFITSFDFTSLYPSLIRAFNIGGDTLLKPYQIHQELKELRDKYFTFFSMKNLNRNEYPDLDVVDGEEVPGKHYELGDLVKKYDGDINDMQEELDYYLSLMRNKEEIYAMLVKHNVCVTPNGYFYRRNEQSIFAGQMEAIFGQRVIQKRLGQEQEGIVEKLKAAEASEQEIQDAVTKQKFHENQSLIKKILINSAFGAASMAVSPFSQGKITGASITTSGRMANMLCALASSQHIQEMIGEEVTDTLKYVAQADTDSHYLNLTNFFKTDKFKNLSKEKKIELTLKLSQGKFQDLINETLRDMDSCMNLLDPDALAMENEVVTSGFVSLKNKRYFCRVEVNDGNILAKPKMKVIGVSLVSYSTPEFIRGKLKPVLDIVLDGTQNDLQNYIKDARDEFSKVDPVEFSRTVRVTKLDYQKKGQKYKKLKDNGKWQTAPAGSTATLEHNRIVKDKDIHGIYPIIEPGESISYVYVKDGNEEGISNYVGWVNPEFGKVVNLSKIADYDVHWERDFLNKIEQITEPLKWNPKQTTQILDVW